MFEMPACWASGKGRSAANLGSTLPWTLAQHSEEQKSSENSWDGAWNSEISVACHRRACRGLGLRLLETPCFLWGSSLRALPSISLNNEVVASWSLGCHKQWHILPHNSCGDRCFLPFGPDKSHVRVQHFGHNHPFPSSNPQEKTLKSRHCTTLCDTILHDFVWKYATARGQLKMGEAFYLQFDLFCLPSHINEWPNSFQNNLCSVIPPPKLPNIIPKTIR